MHISDVLWVVIGAVIVAVLGYAAYCVYQVGETTRAQMREETARIQAQAEMAKAQAITAANSLVQRRKEECLIS